MQDIDDQRIFIGRQVTASRALLGCTQRRLANSIGCSRSTLAALEAGSSVSIDTLLKVRSAIERAGVRLTERGVELTGEAGRHVDG